MRKTSIGIMLAASLSLGACATRGYDDGYYADRNQGQLGRAAAGAAIGAAAGAGVGAVVGGVSPTQGAIAGAVVGGAVGAATSENRRWYRDGRGDCYYVDARGDRRYDYDRRC